MSALRNDRGLTLVEVVITLALLGILAVGMSDFLYTCLRINESGETSSEVRREALFTMERLTRSARLATFLLVPNAHNPSRNILALSGFVNDDKDFYFGDTLFPRIDEDLGFEMVEDFEPGIKGIDDDGDLWTDENSGGGGEVNDDEDPWPWDEDPINGIDDDGDGNVDEDCGGDKNDDGASGIKGIDDDGDGWVDESAPWDDDEDGTWSEVGLIPTIFEYDSTSGELTESVPYLGTSTVITHNVSRFLTRYHDPSTLEIILEVVGAMEDTLRLSEFVYIRNTYQRTGKRVR